MGKKVVNDEFTTLIGEFYDSFMSKRIDSFAFIDVVKLCVVVCLDLFGIVFLEKEE